MTWLRPTNRPGSTIHLSTAITDLVLMTTAFGATRLLRARGERYASTGLMLIGIAAFIGSLRYSINPDLAELHVFVTALAACTGLPLIAVQYSSTLEGWPGHDGRMNTMGIAVVGFAVFGLAFPLPIYPLVVGALSMAVIIGVCIHRLRPNPSARALGVLGALGFLIAGLGSTAMLSPFSDFFLLILALSVLGLAGGLPARTSDLEL